MQSRYKKDFDRRVNPRTTPLRTGDLVYLDAHHTPLEETTLQRPRTKLDHLTVGLFPVVEVAERTVVVDIRGVPERVSRERVTRAPLERREHETVARQGEETLQLRKTRKTPRGGEVKTPPERETEASVPPDGPQEEYVIDSLLSRGKDIDGRDWALVKWDGFDTNQATWEPESNLPPAIIVRFKKTHGLTQENLSYD